MIQYISKDALVAEIEKLILNGKLKCQQSQENNDQRSYIAWSEHIATCGKVLTFINTLEVKKVDLEKSIDVDSMVTEYLKQYEEAGQTPFAMNIIGSAYRKGLEDMFRLKAQKGEDV